MSVFQQREVATFEVWKKLELTIAQVYESMQHALDERRKDPNLDRSDPENVSVLSKQDIIILGMLLSQNSLFLTNTWECIQNDLERIID